MRVLQLLALVLFLCVGLGSATTYYLYPNNSTWSTTISNLQAGDTAVLAGGTYILDGDYSVTLTGSASSPIVVQGAGANNTIIQQNSGQNIINIVGQYFSFYNLTFTGGSRGVRLGPSSTSYATFDGVRIYHTQATAFSANDAGAVYSNLLLRRMEIYDTGSDTSECFYLGCNYDGCQVHDSIVELNYCHDIQLASPGYGSGIQLKTGSYNNILRDNVLYKTRSPGILAYDDYQRGANIIEGNVVINTLDNGIQVTSGVILRNNIVVDAGSSGIYVANNQNQNAGVYHNIEIVHNTVYSSGSSDLYLPALSGSGFVIANNAFLSSNAFSVQTQTSTVWLNNAYVAGTVASGVAANGVFQVTTGAVIDVSSNNFYPAINSSLINAGSTSYSPLALVDFNGTPRSATTPTVGAYEYTTATNPGYAIGPHFKDGSSAGGDSGNHSGTGCLASWLSVLMAADVI